MRAADRASVWLEVYVGRAAKLARLHQCHGNRTTCPGRARGQGIATRVGWGMSISISVVIGTYQRRQLLPEVLDPILADPSADEVIVVVDGSTDGSIEYLRQRAFDEPRLRPVFTPNSGEGATRQRGLEEASGDVVLFLDDDVVAGPGLVTGHREHHERLGPADDRIVLGYMPTVEPKTRNADSFTTLLYAKEYLARCEKYESSTPAGIARHIWGGNLSIPRKLALQVGMSNPDYLPSYFADREWGLRCLEVGVKADFDRSLAAEHRHYRSAEKFFHDAAMQGRGDAYLHYLHPELGPLDLERYSAGLPGGLGTIVQLGANPRVYPWLRKSLLWRVTTLGRRRQWKSQLRAAQLLRRIEQLRGCRQAIDDLSAPERHQGSHRS